MKEEDQFDEIPLSEDKNSELTPQNEYENAKLENTVLQKLDLRNQSFNNSTLTEVMASGSFLTGTTFNGTILNYSTSFAYSNMMGVNLSLCKGIAKSVDFTGTVLINAIVMNWLTEEQIKQSIMSRKQLLEASKKTALPYPATYRSALLDLAKSSNDDKECQKAADSLLERYGERALTPDDIEQGIKIEEEGKYRKLVTSDKQTKKECVLF